MQKPKLIIICGPTASGKSDLAVSIAKWLGGPAHLANQALQGVAGGEIVSADSRQVYKGLDIGTGKITKEEMQGVPHHLLDIAKPEEVYTASDYLKDAEDAINKIIANKKVPIICGGTGFYIDTLLGKKVLPEVGPNEELRKELEQKSEDELFQILQASDEERAKNIDSKNKRRLVRAIEICKALGKVPTIDENNTEQEKYETLKIGIKIEDEELKNRIGTRLLKRMGQGMMEEAERLHEEGLGFQRMEDLGLEYRYLAMFLQNKITKEEMLNELEKEIWHYAKRQMTWFKKDKDIVWVSPKDKEEIIRKISEFIKS